MSVVCSLAGKHTGVCETQKTPPEKRRLGMLASNTPNQGLESTLRSYVARKRLTEKVYVFKPPEMITHTIKGIEPTILAT